MTVATIVILAVIGYAWILYPVLLLVAARAHGKRTVSTGSAPCAERKAVLLSAYNEESVIGERIRNLLECTDCDTRILVGTDGCTDETAGIATSLASENERIAVLVFSERRGKMAVLKDLAKEAGLGEGAEILVFTDANAAFEKEAVARLCAPFANDRVGGVCGRLVFVDASEEGHRDRREGVYWRWETRLKTRESAVDSCLGANGAIYAIRASLFDMELPENTIIDDFVIGMKVREKGFRMVYEPCAIAREDLPAVIADEWGRRVRIGAGDFQALSLCRRCLSPGYGAFAWMFFSHKVLRWFTPHLGVAAVLLALASVGVNRLSGPAFESYFAAGTLWVAAALSGCTVVGHVARRFDSRSLRIFQQWHYFVLMQSALLAGSVRFCRGGLKGYWSRTPRGDSV